MLPVRARRTPDRGARRASASWARQQIRAALDFLAWLDEHGLDLAQAGQPDIDAWLTSRPSQRYAVRYFRDWARRRRLAGPVNVSLRMPRSPEQALPEDQRWQQLQRCLHDPSLPHRVRVAGALLLLYGQPISRTVQMKASQLSHSDDRRVYLVLDRHPVLRPPVLARLIQERHMTATPTAVLGGRGGPTTWLFPGQVPGRHLAVNGLVRQLNEHGIQARISRSYLAARAAPVGELVNRADG